MRKQEVIHDPYFEGYISNYRKYESTFRQLELYFLMVKKVIDQLKLKRNGRILDIGCAYGIFLSFFDKIGWETYGVDISEYALNKARNYTKAKLYLHDVEKGLGLFDNNFFDVITMFDIIEHLRNPIYLLEEAQRVVKQKGLIFVTTPNVNSVTKVLMGKNWPALKDRTHKILFTPYILKFAVERIGFKILEVKTPQFYPFTKFSITNNKLFLFLIKHFPGGSSIWLVAKK